MLRLRKTTPGDPLVVSMTGLRLGDRVLIVGAGDPKAAALLAVKPGLTGRVCLVEEDARRAARGAEAAQREGVLVETETSPITQLPYAPAAFDVVVINHLLPELTAERQIVLLNEASRVLRPGGRCVVIQRAQRSGLAAVFGRGGEMSASDVEAALSGAAFRGVRTLAERDGLLFAEGATRGRDPVE